MLAMTKTLKGAYSCWYCSCFGVAVLYMGTAIVTRRCAYVEWLGVNVYVKLCQLQTTHQSPTTGAGTDGDSVTKEEGIFLKLSAWPVSTHFSSVN